MAIVEPVEATAGERRRLRLKSPATLEVIGELDVANADDVRAALERARRAQAAWAARTVAERADLLAGLAKVVLDRQEQIIDAIVREVGRSRIETLYMEIFPALDSIGFYTKRAPKVLADRKQALHGLMKTKKLLMTYRPLGVVGIITPWNGPFILALNPTVQALLAGNAVLLKPSEVAPFSARIVGDLLAAVGLPDGLFQVLLGDGETGAALVEAGVDKISFTGSVRTGRKIGEACGRNLIPCTLELGGKDPMIVCDDADLERAAAGAVWSACFNSGQVCMSTERIYVMESVADAFLEKVVQKVKELRQGATGEFDVGAMIWPAQLALVERHVEDARAKGARVLAGGQRRSGLDGLFYEPTVLADVTPDMDVIREETFGPLLPIVRVADEEEAIRLANATEYGLSASVWTKDAERGVRIAKRLESGSVTINDAAIAYGINEAPFGGRKASGVGQVNGETGLRGFCHAQPIVSDRFQQPSEVAWYPYTPEKGQQIQKIMKFLWGGTLGRLPW